MPATSVWTHRIAQVYCPQFLSSICCHWRNSLFPSLSNLLFLNLPTTSVWTHRIAPIYFYHFTFISITLHLSPAKLYISITLKPLHTLGMSITLNWTRGIAPIVCPGFLSFFSCHQYTLPHSALFGYWSPKFKFTDYDFSLKFCNWPNSTLFSAHLLDFRRFTV